MTRNWTRARVRFAWWLALAVVAGACARIHEDPATPQHRVYLHVTASEAGTLGVFIDGKAVGELKFRAGTPTAAVFVIHGTNVTGQRERLLEVRRVGNVVWSTRFVPDSYRHSTLRVRLAQVDFDPNEQGRPEVADSYAMHFENGT